MRSKVVLLKSQIASHGGLEKYTLHLAKAFVARGCEVTMLTAGEVPSLFRDTCEVIPLISKSRLSVLHLYRFDQACQQWLKNHPSEIIFGLDRNSFQTHYRAGNGVHRTYLAQRILIEPAFKRFTLSLNPLHRMILRLEREAFEHPGLQRLFTNSHMVRNEIIQQYQTPPERIHVVHNGVQWAQWQTHFDHTPEKNPRAFQFLFVGHDYRRKGLEFLLHGLSRLKNRDWELTVIGKDKKIHEFQNIAHRLNLTKQVHFLGPQPDIVPYYQASDALVIPSIYDPFANVTVEALAMGLFVVSSAFNGGKEVLTKESGTIIQNLTEPDSVAEALNMALKHAKTHERSLTIRQTIQHLDFPHQLNTIINQTLTHAK